MSGTRKVIVAGAGALGLTSALMLARSGCRVAVFDPSAAGANASAVAAGMLAPVFEAVLDEGAAGAFDLLIAARNLWPAMEATVGARLDRAGAVAVGSETWLKRTAAGMTRIGVHPTELPRRAVEGLAPGLSDAFAGALMTREDWRLDPAATLARLAAAARDAGVTFHARPVTGDAGADRLVIATGAAHDLAPVAPELSCLLPIKGHILELHRPGWAGVVVRGEGAYAAPAALGVRVGATMETGVSDPVVDPARAGPLASAATALFPALAGAPQQLRAGVRAASPDGLPLVGLSSNPKVVLATGARRNGWLLAPLAAGVVVASVLGEDPGPYAARLDPRRFGL